MVVQAYQLLFRISGHRCLQSSLEFTSRNAERIQQTILGNRVKPLALWTHWNADKRSVLLFYWFTAGKSVENCTSTIGHVDDAGSVADDEFVGGFRVLEDLVDWDVGMDRLLAADGYFIHAFACFVEKRWENSQK